MPRARFSAPSPSALPRLCCVIVTPDLHKVHHSDVRAEQNSNFSSLFSRRDRIARTLRLSRDARRIAFGLDS